MSHPSAAGQAGNNARTEIRRAGRDSPIEASSTHPTTHRKKLPRQDPHPGTAIPHHHISPLCSNTLRNSRAPNRGLETTGFPIASCRNSSA